MINEDKIASDMALLVGRLRDQHGLTVAAVLLYGSCLRNRDLRDGIADIYLIVDNYRSCYRFSLRALGNWLLPPNVFYIEVPTPDGPIRCKYAIISTGDFHRGTAARCFESYLWGRFCQPVELAWTRDDSVEETLLLDFKRASRSLLLKALPGLPPSGSLAAAWSSALAMSYAVELRTERGERSEQLISHDLSHYQRQTQAVAADLPFSLRLSQIDGQWCYDASIVAWRRKTAHLTWPLRSVFGKCLSILRLLKALFTFEGGLDYLVWKLERHSGQKVELSPRTRRWPLIFIWADMVRLYRRGVFR